MSGKKIEKKYYQTFEGLREINEFGQEFWTARKLAKILEYSEYRHFLPVIKKAREACHKSGHAVQNHFEDFLGMVEIGSGAKRELPDVIIEKYLSIAVIGIRDGRQISIPDFMTVKIPCPPLEQQKQIASILNTARQEIDLLKKQAEAYRRQKCGLMQKLLTGTWRVNTGKNIDEEPIPDLRRCEDSEEGAL